MLKKIENVTYCFVIWLNALKTQTYVRGDIRQTMRAHYLAKITLCIRVFGAFNQIIKQQTTFIITFVIPG